MVALDLQTNLLVCGLDEGSVAIVGSCAALVSNSASLVISCPPARGEMEQLSTRVRAEEECTCWRDGSKVKCVGIQRMPE